MVTLPILEGGQIRLRPITLADTDLIVNWRNQPDIKRHFVFQADFTREMHEAWVKQKVFSGEVVQYIIETKADGQPVGSVYLRDIDSRNHSAELGIWLGQAECTGRGLGTEAAALLTRFAFRELELHRVFLRVFTENTRAISCYKRAGFREEGIARHCVYRDGRYLDMMFLSAINEETQYE